MLDLLVYLDEALIKNLNSVILNGYIDIRTYRRIKDRTIGGNIKIGDRESNGSDFGSKKDKIEGYKTKQERCDDHYENGSDRSLGFEGRDFDRNEQEIKKISTIFTLHGSLLNRMYDNKNVKKISYKDMESGNIKEGEYVEVDGFLKETSLPFYIDTLIYIINCYGADFLNTLLEKKNLKNLNFNIICKLLERLRMSITSRGSHDLLMQNEDISLLLTINENNFLSNHAHMFNLVHCSCKVFGKVMMIKEDENKCISLLRKTSQEEYYQQVIDSIDPYLEVLKENNIILPKKPECNIKGKVIMILPISICI
ncbi:MULTISPECIES: hypothetical protein [Clostridium]|jgi:hypothetical protein|uniref:Uncharacterized protein n=1 Tax=bioreactor metagenome TaxID=1076179 RepID=A0A644W6L7_9ZZZZ|nr:hypothetical protein [Clostridium sp. C8]KLE16637.1 hypothetical protein AAT22_05140 [Clostridium sp. C8]